MLRLYFNCFKELFLVLSKKSIFFSQNIFKINNKKIKNKNKKQS